MNSHSRCNLCGLFFILIAVGYCASSLGAIEREIECLHEDFNKVYHAHSWGAEEP
jgi:hypothetical protein